MRYFHLLFRLFVGLGAGFFLMSAIPVFAVGECAKYRSTCETLSSENYLRMNVECALPAASPCSEKDPGGKVTTYYCCKRTEGCKDTCVAAEKCVAGETQIAENKGGLDCPVGEICCAFSPKPSGSTEAAKEAAAGTSTEPVFIPEPPLKTAAKYGYAPPLGDITINQIVGRILKTLFPLVGALFFAMFLYGGFLWITANGEEKKLTQARHTLGQACIGMVIVVGAYVIVFNLVNLLGGVLGGGGR